MLCSSWILGNKWIEMLVTCNTQPSMCQGMGCTQWPSASRLISSNFWMCCLNFITHPIHIWYWTMFILCICSRVKLDGSLGVTISLFVLGACSLFDPIMAGIISLQSRGDNQWVMEPMKQLMNESVTKQIWLVVWNMAFIFPYIGNNHPNWLIFFRGVGQPPTSNDWRTKQMNEWMNWRMCGSPRFVTVSTHLYHGKEETRPFRERWLWTFFVTQRQVDFCNIEQEWSGFIDVDSPLCQYIYIYICNLYVLYLCIYIINKYNIYIYIHILFQIVPTSSRSTRRVWTSWRSAPSTGMPFDRKSPVQWENHRPKWRGCFYFYFYMYISMYIYTYIHILYIYMWGWCIYIHTYVCICLWIFMDFPCLMTRDDNGWHQPYQQPPIQHRFCWSK